jgi:hypothetical protein
MGTDFLLPRVTRGEDDLSRSTALRAVGSGARPAPLLLHARELRDPRAQAAMRSIVEHLLPRVHTVGRLLRLVLLGALRTRIPRLDAVFQLETDVSYRVDVALSRRPAASLHGLGLRLGSRSKTQPRVHPRRRARTLVASSFPELGMDPSEHALLSGVPQRVATGAGGPARWVIPSRTVALPDVSEAYFTCASEMGAGRPGHRTTTERLAGLLGPARRGGSGGALRSSVAPSAKRARALGLSRGPHPLYLSPGSRRSKAAPRQ